MTCSKRHFRAEVFFVQLLLATACCGCIQGDIFELLAYDPAIDTFRYLQLDLNIAGETPADLMHLADLWDKRDHVIMHPEVFRLWSLPAILRIDASHYKTINLAHADTTNNPALETAIPLDTIKVQPGQFFLTKDNTLGYYHEVTASGKVVDEALAIRNKEFFGPTLVEAIDKELKRRADGGKSLSWADIREQLVKGIRAAEEEGGGGVPDAKAASTSTSPSHADASEGAPFDDTSLKSLRDAIAAGEMGIRRHGAELELAMPLSANDCRELKETIDLWNKESPKMFNTKPGDYETSLKGRLRAENAGGRRLVVTLNLMSLSNQQQSSYAAAKPNPKFATSYRATIAALRSRSIPIDDKLTAKQIVDKFTAKQQ